jgi:hypothetical protein
LFPLILVGVRPVAGPIVIATFAITITTFASLSTTASITASTTTTATTTVG